MKRLLRFSFFGLLILAVLLLVLSFIPYKESSYSYLDQVRLKLCRYIEDASYEGYHPSEVLEQTVIDTLNIPAYRVTYSNDVEAYFNDLWEGYEKGFDGITYTAEGQNYYLENRKWQDASFQTPQGEFDVKIRAHGKLPDAHHFGSNFSFQVKGKELEEQFGSKKLRFIIYQRVGAKDDHLDFMEERFGLLRDKENEMVKVSLNGLSEYLYYIESSELAPNAFSEHKVINEIGDFKSGISAMSNDPDVDLVELKGSGLYESYAKFQQAVDAKDYEYVLEHSNEDYLLNYFAVKTIYGFSGHECYPANFYLHYDTLEAKFYPAISREPVFNVLPDDLEFKSALGLYNHAVVNRRSTALNYYQAVLSSPAFVAKLKKHLRTIVENDGDAIVENWNNNNAKHRQFVKSSSLWEFLYPDRGLIDLNTNFDWILAHTEE